MSTEQIKSKAVVEETPEKGALEEIADRKRFSLNEFRILLTTSIAAAFGLIYLIFDQSEKIDQKIEHKIEKAESDLRREIEREIKRVDDEIEEAKDLIKEHKH